MARRHLEASAADLSDDARLELAHLYAREQCWDKALPLLESLAARNDHRAMERLAIYHEHRARDFDKALAWTERMRPLLASAAVEAAERRRARLLRRRESRGVL
jgi:TPR repeat protein